MQRPFLRKYFVVLLAFLTAVAPVANANPCRSLLAERAQDLPVGNVAESRELWSLFMQTVLREGEAQRARLLGTRVPENTEPIVTVHPDRLTVQYETGRAVRDGVTYEPVEHEAYRGRLLQLEAALDGGESNPTVQRPLPGRAETQRFLATPQPPAPVVVPAAPSVHSSVRRVAAFQRFVVLVGSILGGLGAGVLGSIETHQKREAKIYVGATTEFNARPGTAPEVDRSALEAALQPANGIWPVDPPLPPRMTEADRQRVRLALENEKLFSLVRAVFLVPVLGAALGGVGWLINRVHHTLMTLLSPMYRRAFAAPELLAPVVQPAAPPSPLALDPQLDIPEIRAFFENVSLAAANQSEAVRYRHLALQVPTGEAVDLLVESRRTGRNATQLRAAVAVWSGPVDFWPPGRTRREVNATTLGGAAAAERLQVNGQLEIARGSLMGKVPGDALPHEEPAVIARLIQRAAEAQLSYTDAYEFARLAARANLGNFTELEQFLAERER